MPRPSQENAGPCPLCGEPLFGWAMSRDPDTGSERVLDRCEHCGVVIRRDRGAIDIDAELAAVGVSDGSVSAIELPNRRSWQASLGEGRWAAIGSGGRMLHTPDSLRRLLERQGLVIEEVSFPPGSGQLDMLQTLINALTFRDNFARDALAGRIHPQTARERAAYAIDAIVSVLAAPLVSLVSIPLELVASLFGRSGRMRVSLKGAGA